MIYFLCIFNENALKFLGFLLFDMPFFPENEIAYWAEFHIVCLGQMAVFMQLDMKLRDAIRFPLSDDENEVSMHMNLQN